MSDGAIPDQAKHFLLRNIDSIAQWEGLLLLRNHPDQVFDILTVAGNLYISVDETAVLLAALAGRGLASETPTPNGLAYGYAPATQELADAVSLAADLYRQYLIPITNLIHARSKSRVQEFANAFRIRKD